MSVLELEHTQYNNIRLLSSLSALDLLRCDNRALTQLRRIIKFINHRFDPFKITIYSYIPQTSYRVKPTM